MLLLWPREECNDSYVTTIPGEEQKGPTGFGLTFYFNSMEISVLGEEIDWFAIPRLVFALGLFVLAITAICRSFQQILYKAAQTPPS